MAFLGYKGALGSGLPLGTKGKLPLGHHARECPCDIDIFTAWEGPQVVADFDYPGSSNVAGPNGFNVLRLIKQLQHYPRDIEDGRIVFQAENSPGTPFPSTVVAAEIIYTSVDATTPDIYGTMVDAPGDLDDLDEEGPLQPNSITINWTSGGPQTATDDGLGQFYIPGAPPTLMVGSSVDYCNRVFYFDFGAVALVPAVATNITLDYTVMGDMQAIDLATGTISGGYCSVDAFVLTQVNYTAWEGWVEGVLRSVVAGNFDPAIGPKPAGRYYIQVNNVGVITSNTSLVAGREVLCSFDWDGAANITGGPYDTRIFPTIVNNVTGEPLDFYYYGLWVYDQITFSWHRCSPTDYALSYDSTRIFEWLWNHLPRHWRSDDTTTLQQLMPKTTLDDGQDINFHEDHGRLRGQLYRFLKFFGLEFERDHAYIKALAILYFDLDKAPEDWLPIIAAMLDCTIPRNWPVMQKRNHLKQCTETYRQKGRLSAVLAAAYKISGLIPTYDYMHSHVLYSNMYDRTSLDIAVVGGIETIIDPHQYAYGPSRSDHHHERGLSLFFTDPSHVLLQDYSRDLLRSVIVGSGPIYTTDDPESSNRLKANILDETDFIRPGSLTINWIDTGLVARSMTDDSYGGFAGDGDPAHSSVDYQTGKIVLKTQMPGALHAPQPDTDITCTFTSTSRGRFFQMRDEIKKAVAGTVYIAYFVNGLLTAVSE